MYEGEYVSSDYHSRLSKVGGFAREIVKLGVLQILPENT
jgi:hypothetical protein